MVFAVLFLTNYNRLREGKKEGGWAKLIKRTLSLLADRLENSACTEKGVVVGSIGVENAI